MMFVMSPISEKYELIRLVTDLLLTLYREGWEPMTPIDTAVDKERASYFIITIKLIVKLRLGSGTQALSGSLRLKLRLSDSGSVTE